MLNALYSIPLAVSLLVGGASAALAADQGTGGGCQMPTIAHVGSSATKSVKHKRVKKAKGPKKARKARAKRVRSAKPLAKKTTRTHRTKKVRSQAPSSPAPAPETTPGT